MRGALVFAFVLACNSGGGGSTSQSHDAAPDAPGPPAPDPRFKWVGAYSSFTTGAQYVGGDGVTLSSTASVYSPAAVGSGDEALTFAFTPPTSLSFTSAFGETSGTLAVAAGMVATSLAFTSSDYVLTTQSANSTTTPTTMSGGSAADLASAVSTAAASGAVTTALGFDGTDRVMLAYADSSVTATYDTTVQTGDITTIGTMATAIAGSGYVITALGQIDGSNFAVVGTRETGSAATHDAMTVTIAAGGADSALAGAQMQGYAVVGGYFSDPLTAMFVLER
jgi:hypothetical protein